MQFCCLAAHASLLCDCHFYGDKTNTWAIHEIKQSGLICTHKLWNQPPKVDWVYLISPLIFMIHPYNVLNVCKTYAYITTYSKGLVPEDDRYFLISQYKLPKCKLFRILSTGYYLCIHFIYQRLYQQHASVKWTMLQELTPTVPRPIILLKITMVHSNVGHD